MHVSHTLVGIGLTIATLSALAACASSGQRASGGGVQTTTAQSGTAAARSNSSVLTAAELATITGITNAYDAVQALRPSFLRTRGSASRPAAMVGAGAEGQATGRRPGQVRGSPTGGSQAGGRGDETANAGRTAQDPGILVYLDRQRYGDLETLRQIPMATVGEIRFLNVGEANSQFGMGHPHGVIQVISKQGPSSQ
jgi:hypothetical protein